jgi:hypothetical protein
MGGSTIFVREIRVGRHRQALQALQQVRCELRVEFDSVLCTSI